METVATSARCARCKQSAAEEELSRACLPSVNAFVAVGITTDAEAMPMDHGDLIDHDRYCKACRWIINVRRVAACAALVGLMLAVGWLASQLW